MYRQSGGEQENASLKQVIAMMHFNKIRRALMR